MAWFWGPANFNNMEPLRLGWSWKWQEGEQVIMWEQSCQALFIFMLSATQRLIGDVGGSVIEECVVRVTGMSREVPFARGLRSPNSSMKNPHWDPSPELSQKAGLSKQHGLQNVVRMKGKGQHSCPGLSLTLSVAWAKSLTNLWWNKESWHDPCLKFFLLPIFYFSDDFET